MAEHPQDEVDKVRKYWSEEYFLAYDEEDDHCADPRVRALLEKCLTPTNMQALADRVKIRLATGLDEFSTYLIKMGGLELAETFTDALVDEVSMFIFPESWSTWGGGAWAGHRSRHSLHHL
jgi:hypothetical protein